MVVLGDYIYFFLDVVGCNLLRLWWLGGVTVAECG